MVARLWFGVLGELEVHRDGASLPLPSGRRRAVLAALVLGIGRAVPVDTLVDAGWGQDVPHEPEGALRTVISRLRAVLGAGVVATTAEGYRLDIDPGQCDAARFESLCSEARTRPVAAAADLLDEALALWRGRAYGRFADHDFARTESARLEQLRRSTVEERGRLALALGDPEDAVARLETLVAEDPLREQALALLTESLYRSGRPAEALERLRRHRTQLAEDLGLDPTPVLGQLEERILRHDLPGVASAPVLSERGGLQAGPGTFVGRDRDFAWLARGLCAYRLVSVTGPGGVGKTRLVTEVLTRMSREPVSRHAFVTLGDVNGGEVSRAVADAIDLGPSVGTTQDQVVAALTASSLVLVLDGCEHVLEEVRSFVQATNRECPRVQVVVTSRVRLGLLEEQVLPLEPLAVPDPEAGMPDLVHAAAVELFLDRLRRVRPQTRVTEDVVRTSARICRRLDGLPLAIELAATKAGSLGLAPTLQHLDASLDLLAERGTDGDGEGASMRAVIDWSYRLLDEPDRALLAALSVYGGPFDLDAAERVDPAADVAQTALGLARLVEASLVAVVPEPEPARYRMLALVRQFARERLAASGNVERTRSAAAHWARDLARECGRLVSGPHGGDAMPRLDRNQTLLVDGVRWALRAERLDLAAQIVGALCLCSHWRPGTVLLELTDRVAEHPALPGTPGEPLALAAAAFGATERGRLARAVDLGNRARERATLPDEHAMALVALGVATLYGGDLGGARRLWRELAALEGASPAYRADSHSSLALLFTYGGKAARAREEVAAALELAEVSGSEVALAFARYAVGEGLLLDDRPAAIPVLREAAEAADRVAAAQIGLVARIALLSGLTREGHLTDAVALAGYLVEVQRPGGRWSPLWTTMRIVAELLARLRMPSQATLLLAAADAARDAPVPVGPDIARYRELRAELRDALGAEELRRITGMAQSLPHAEVGYRAAIALADAAEVWTAGSRPRATGWSHESQFCRTNSSTLTAEPDVESPESRPAAKPPSGSLAAF